MQYDKLGGNCHSYSMKSLGTHSDNPLERLRTHDGLSLADIQFQAIAQQNRVRGHCEHIHEKRTDHIASYEAHLSRGKATIAGVSGEYTASLNSSSPTTST